MEGQKSYTPKRGSACSLRSASNSLLNKRRATLLWRNRVHFINKKPPSELLLRRSMF